MFIAFLCHCYAPFTVQANLWYLWIKVDSSDYNLVVCKSSISHIHFALGPTKPLHNLTIQIHDTDRIVDSGVLDFACKRSDSMQPDTSASLQQYT